MWLVWLWVQQLLATIISRAHLGQSTWDLSITTELPHLPFITGMWRGSHSGGQTAAPTVHPDAIQASVGAHDLLQDPDVNAAAMPHLRTFLQQVCA